jgi:hypothetical protein
MAVDARSDLSAVVLIDITSTAWQDGLYQADTITAPAAALKG